MKSLASKHRRIYETIVTFDLRYSKSHPVEKNNVEIGPKDIPFEINDAREALALKFGVKKDFVQVGSFGRVNDSRKYGVVCGCGCRGNTRHIFVHTNQEDPSEFPVCVCAPVGGSLHGALPVESTVQSSFILDGNLIRADTYEIANLKPVAFLQLIRQEDVDISLLFHNDPGVETKYTLTVRNTDSVRNIKQEFVRRHAASMKAVNKCLSLSKECRILEDSCIPNLHTIDSDGNFISEKITVPLTLHCHPTESVLVEVEFHSLRFPVIVPSTSNFNDLRKEIAKVINKPHVSLEYTMGMAWYDLVSQHAGNQSPPRCVEVEVREALDLIVVVREENSEKEAHVPVRLYRHDSLATLKNAVAAKIPVAPECLWFHTLVDGSIPPNDLPLIEFLEHSGKNTVLQLRGELHRHCLALEVRDKKHKVSDCLLVDNAKERTLGQLGQYLQRELGESVMSQVRVYHEKQFIHEDCGKSLFAAGIKNLQELIVHFASECQPRSPYKMCFEGDAKGSFHQRWFREIDGVPHYGETCKRTVRNKNWNASPAQEYRLAPQAEPQRRGPGRPRKKSGGWEQGRVQNSLNSSCGTM